MKSLSRPFSLDKHSNWKNKLCFQEFFDSLIIKIFSCLICTLIITFENAYCVFVCMFEKYGGDPLKRSMKNQVVIQIWYTGIISNNICTPLLTCQHHDPQFMYESCGTFAHFLLPNSPTHALIFVVSSLIHWTSGPAGSCILQRIPTQVVIFTSHLPIFSRIFL